MRFKYKLATAIFIQPIGVAALFLTVWYLGNFVGIEIQGYFSALKSQIDLLVAILIFGLPQSVIYQINNGGASRLKLLAGATIYSMLGCLILIVIHALFAETLSTFTNGIDIDYVVILAVTALVFHRLMRGIFVTVHDDWRFSVITISPAVGLALIIVLLPNVDRTSLEAAYLVSTLVAIAFTLYLFRGGYTSGNNPQWRLLWGNGVPIFLQSIVMALQPVIIFAWIRQYTQSLGDVAHFSIGLYAYNAGVLPITMVAPLLFNRWSGESAHNILAGFRKIVYFSLLLIPFLMGASALVPWVIKLAFSSEYIPAISNVQIMLCAIPFAFITLFSMPAFMSVGKFAINTWLAILRLTTMLVALYILILNVPSSWSAALVAALAWFVAEIVVACGVFYAIYNNRNLLTKNEAA